MSRWRAETYGHAEKATRSWLWRGLWLASAFLIIPYGFSKEGMDRNARIEIIRGLLREMAVTKVPLPRGKRGVRVDAKGKLDQEAAQKEMHLKNGVAIQPGAPAVITKIEFKSNQVTFEVNGGRSRLARSGTNTSRSMGDGSYAGCIGTAANRHDRDHPSPWILVSPFPT